MNSIKTYLNSLGRSTRVLVLALAVVVAGAGIAQAATTISTNIVTEGKLTAVNASTTQSATIAGPLWVGGNATTTAAGALTLNGAFSGTSGTFSTTLGVTGVTTLSNSSTTQSATIAGPLWVGGNATTTAAGALTLNGAFSGTSGTFSTTLGVTGVTTLSNSSTTQSATIAGPLWVGGNATTTAAGATSMRSTLTVGATGNAVNNIVAGYCVTPSVAILATNASSTQTYANCTPQDTAASLLTSSSRVFVQATSSLPYYVVIQSASSTASGGLINVGMTNFSTTTAVAAAVYAFNFWAFQ